MKTRRKFTPEFKSQVVLQLLSGEQNMAELCRAHQLTSQMIGNWKQQFVAAASRAFERDRSAALNRNASRSWNAWSGD